MYLKCLIKRSKMNNLKTAVLITCLMTAAISLCFAEDIDAASTVLRNKVFNLKHISAAQAKRTLDGLGIGTDINSMPSNTAIVFTTDKVTDMQKASSILKVIDTNLEYQAAPVLIKPSINTVPNSARLDAYLQNVSVCSFLRTPADSSKPAVLVDMHNDDLIIIAPKQIINTLTNSVRKYWEDTIIAGRSSANEVKIVSIDEDLSSDVKPLTSQNILPITSGKDIPARTKPYLKLSSKTLEQSTGPDSQPQESDLQVKITVGEKQTTTRLKGNEVVSQTETLASPAGNRMTDRNVSTTDTVNDDDMYTDILNELSRTPEAVPVTPQANEEIPEIITVENIDIDNTQTQPEPAQDQEPSLEELIRQLTQDSKLDLPEAISVPANQTNETPVYNEMHFTSTDNEKPIVDDYDKIEIYDDYPTPFEEEDNYYESDGIKILTPSKKDSKQTLTNDWLQAESLSEEQEDETLQPEEEGRVTIPISMLSNKTETKDNSEIDTGYNVDIPGTEEEMNTILNIPQEIEIIELIELVGKQLGLNYMYDPGKIRGKVTLKINDGKIMVKDLYALVESVLNFRNLVMTRRGNLVTIVPQGEAVNIDPVLRKNMNDIKPGDIVVGSVFKLKYIAPSEAVTLLRNMKLGISTQPIEETGTLIVVEYAYRMPRVAELLNMIDIEGEPKKFAFRELKHTTATSLVQQVKNITQQLGNVSISVASTAAAKTTATTAAARTAAARTAAARTATTNGGADSVYLDIDERTNRILMIGIIEDLKIVNELIGYFDVPKRDPRKIYQYEIQYVDASEVVNTLNQLGIISYNVRGGSSSRTRTTAVRTTAAAGANSAATVAGDDILPGEEPQVVVLGATNSLLINATLEQHEQIASIIGHVDRKLEDNANPYVIYRLENQNPEELAETLDRIVNATLRQRNTSRTATASTSSDPRVTTPSTSTGVTARDMEDQIEIVPDKNTFSIIVYASKKNQEQIARMIKELDQRRPQVFMDVTLVEISKDDNFQYDLDMVTALPDMLSMSGQIAATGDVLTKLATSGRNSFQELHTGGGTMNAFYGDKQINALLTLMQTKNYGRVLAQPKILVNDNEPGTINSDKTIYVARKSSTGSGGDNDFVAETTVFDEFTSGINLSITPHISEGELLRLEIELKRSQQESISKTNNSNSETTVTTPPDRTENNINTIVTVPDNSTIILGGINELSQNKISSKVPILGEIPLIGGLFQSTNNTDSQTKLYIFVKAYILRPDNKTQGLPELVERSDEYKDAFEAEEKKFQEHNWGTFKKTNPMDPEKILDVK